MEDLLNCKDLQQAKPKETSDVDWKKLDRKAVGYIR